MSCFPECGASARMHLPVRSKLELDNPDTLDQLSFLSLATPGSVPSTEALMKEAR